MLEHIRIGQIGNSMLRYTEGGGQATKCVYLSIFGSARDVGLGVGRGLQSTVNDAGAHHLDNGSQHGVLSKVFLGDTMCHLSLFYLLQNFKISF